MTTTNTLRGRLVTVGLCLAMASVGELTSPVAAHAQEPARGASGAAATAAQGAPTPGRRKRQPPPPVIPTAETLAADRQFRAGNYEGAVAQAKAALTKNEKYTPAMLVMAKSYYKLRKYEWVKSLWEMMQAGGASNAERAEMYNLLAFMEREKGNGPGAIELFRKAVELRPEFFTVWNNLGAQYLEAKNYKEAVPALERAVQLQPAFAKAYVNLGSSYRGLKEYEKAQSSYERALQLFPNYADAVFHLGLLYLDAEKMQNMDATARLNAAIGYLNRYKQMMGGSLPRTDPAETYIAEAQDKIGREQKRIERLKKQEERDRQRAAQKTAAPGQPGQPGGAATPAATRPAAPAR